MKQSKNRVSRLKITKNVMVVVGANDGDSRGLNEGVQYGYLLNDMERMFDCSRGENGREREGRNRGRRSRDDQRGSKGIK